MSTTLAADPEIDLLMEAYLKEDIRSGDVTTLACIPEDRNATARVVLKQGGIVAGLPLLELLFRKLDPRVEVQLLVKEGSYQKAGTQLATISGPARAILGGERTALNLLQHVSGVATATAAYVKKVAGYGCSILDTRKTLPGLRSFEKYAVRMGGGINHRFGLDGRFVIKLGHLAILKSTTQHPIQEGVAKVRQANPDLIIEIEIDDIDMIDEALKTEAKVIILCNMPPAEVKRCVEKIKKTDKKAYVQDSGTITLDTIRSYAETGVNGISIGSLTHCVPSLDIGFKM